MERLPQIPRAAQSTESPLICREIAPGIHWLGMCVELRHGQETFHIHNTSSYLIKGGSASLLVDTGTPAYWPSLERNLDNLLPASELTWIFPTHLEYPHAGALERLLGKYDATRVIADSDDYEMYFPEQMDRVTHASIGDELDLGDGYRFTFLRAPIKDLVNTLWGYERSQQVMFVADGFAYTHHGLAGTPGEPMHTPAECGLFSSELSRRLGPSDAAYLNQEAFWWTRYRDIAPFIEEIRNLVQSYPPKLIAPAHGGVIDDVANFIPIIQRAHQMAYLGHSRTK